MKRYLIVTADDYGFSAERNKGILETFSKGAVTGASLLLNCTDSEEGAQEAMAQNMCLGLHLNLTEGKKLCGSKLPTLTDSNDEFHGMFGLPKLLDSNKVDKDQIRTEIQSQIKVFEEMVGSKPAYVDGHQHIHVHSEVTEILASVMKEHGILITRYPVERNVGAKAWVNPSLKPFFMGMMERCETARPVLDKYGIRYADSYTGLSTMGSDMTVERLQRNILEAFEHAEHTHPNKTFVTCELMTHPGYPTSREFGGFSWGTDDFGASEERVHEIAMLTDPAMAAFYKDNGIELVPHDILLSA